jgi:N-acetylneuraminate lyase
MSQQSRSLHGLVAATFTPMREDGAIDAAAIRPLVDRLVEEGIAGLYVLGSTGEGPSLTHEERCLLAEQFIGEAAGRVPVIVQVGSESLTQARRLAAHAQAAGADAISAVSPVYFKPDSVDALVESMHHVAGGAPQLPFYYYHIPAVTGVTVNVLDFLRLGGARIPNLRGLKFTSPAVHEFQACVEFDGGRFDVLWGLDEMLMSGLSAGARGAVGSTYNFASPIYRRLRAAWSAGDLDGARLEQSRSQAVVRTFVRYGARAAQKAIMAFVGCNCGPTRLPVMPLSAAQAASLRRDLEEIGFFEWIAGA